MGNESTGYELAQRAQIEMVTTWALMRGTAPLPTEAPGACDVTACAVALESAAGHLAKARAAVDELAALVEEQTRALRAREQVEQWRAAKERTGVVLVAHAPEHTAGRLQWADDRIEFVARWEPLERGDATAPLHPAAGDCIVLGREGKPLARLHVGQHAKHGRIVARVDGFPPAPVLAAAARHFGLAAVGRDYGAAWARVDQQGVAPLPLERDADPAPVPRLGP